MVRVDYVFVVVKVGKKKNSYRLCKKKPKLDQTEFAYKLRIQLNEEDWFDRIMEVEMEMPNPPNLPKAEVAPTMVEKDTAYKVMDRLTE